MTRKLTAEERQRIGLVDVNVEEHDRGWTKDEIKEAIKQSGFSAASLERAFNVAPTSINQALNKRSPKIDKMIAAFLNVHESVIWPNRYLVNGVSISSRYNIEQQSDEFLAKLNHEAANPPRRRTVEVGGKVVFHDESKAEVNLTADLTLLREKYGTDEEGRIVIPMNGEFPDVPSRADHRVENVTLPVGMKLDVK